MFSTSISTTQQGVSVATMAESGLPDYVQEQYPEGLELEHVLEEFKTAAMQLELIHAGDEMFDYAAQDIFTAQINIRKWQVAGLITSAQVKSFQAILARINSEKNRSVPEDHPNLSEDKIGQRILDDSNEAGRAQKIPNVAETPPPHTAEGILQMLANDKKAGWAIDWPNKLEKLEQWKAANERPC